MRSHVSVLSTATETALAVGIASLRRREQGARKPLMQPAKAFPPVQVRTTGVRRALITATLFAVVMGGFFIEMINYTYLGKLHLSVFLLHIRQQQSMSTSCKRSGQHNMC